MDLTLLSHQKQLLHSIASRLNCNNYVVIVGKSGSGKSYSFQWLEKNYVEYGFELAILIDGNCYNEERDYFPFKKALSSKLDGSLQRMKLGAVEVAKDTPFVGNSASYILNSLFTAKFKNKAMFNEEEQVIINAFKKLTKNKHTCVICDNIHWWDYRSLQLLLSFLNSKSLLFEKEQERIKFVLSITENQESRNNDILKSLLIDTKSDAIIPLPKFDYWDFCDFLNKKTNHSLTEQQLKLLNNLVNGHLKIYFEIINEINCNSFDFNSNFDNSKTYLSEVLNKRLKECGASGTQIAEVLEYASIIGMSFSSLELVKITNHEKSTFKKIIETSSELSLTESTAKSDYYKFAHNIIREIFKSRVDSEHLEYYRRLALCLKEIKPGQYLRRARYLTYSHDTDLATVMYCLEIIAQLRIYGNVANALLQEAMPMLSRTQKEYIKYMRRAYTAYHIYNFDAAIAELSLISSYYPGELIAERDLLKLRCLSKKLATEETVNEIKRLDKKRIENNHMFNGEKEVQERFSHALVTAFAHLGEISNAREIEEELMESLSSRIDFDEAAATRAYVVHRNANATHGVDVAPFFVKRAVDYFGESNENGDYRNIRQYYSSLINYSAVLIKQGDFSVAHSVTMQALKLEHDNFDISFPRTQILKNNFILAAVLDNKIKAKDAIELYRDILSRLTGVMAEKLFYTSNQSIMYALDNQIEKAQQILQNEALKHDIDNDREGIYRYRVITNQAIYQYLLGNQAQAIESLELISSILRNLVNGTYFYKKNEILIKIMQENIKLNGHGWIGAVHHECRTFQGRPWRYFGLGYAFAALCDWGI